MGERSFLIMPPPVAATIDLVRLDHPAALRKVHLERQMAMPKPINCACNHDLLVIEAWGKRVNQK